MICLQALYILYSCATGSAIIKGSRLQCQTDDKHYMNGCVSMCQGFTQQGGPQNEMHVGHQSAYDQHTLERFGTVVCLLTSVHQNTLQVMTPPYEHQPCSLPGLHSTEGHLMFVNHSAVDYALRLTVNVFSWSCIHCTQAMKLCLERATLPVCTCGGLLATTLLDNHIAE